MYKRMYAIIHQLVYIKRVLNMKKRYYLIRACKIVEPKKKKEELTACWGFISSFSNRNEGEMEFSIQ